MENPPFHRIIGLNEESTLHDPTPADIETQIRRLNPTDNEFEYYLSCGMLLFIHMNPQRVSVYFFPNSDFGEKLKISEYGIGLADRDNILDDTMVKLFGNQVDEIGFFQTVKIDYAIA